MQLIYSPVALPGCCFICRAAQRDSYIDTGVSLDFEGAFIICNLCVNEMAHIMSYISHDEYKELRASKDELDRISYELIRRVGALEESLSALANAGYRSNDDGTVTVSGGYLPKTMESEPEKPSRRKTTVGAGKGETSESVHDSGVGELRTDESGSDFTLEF